VGENVIILYLTQLSVINRHTNVTSHTRISSSLERYANCFRFVQRERKWGGGVVTDTIFNGVLKVPRQYPLVLLVELRLREGKALGSKKIQFYDVDFATSRGNVELGLYCPRSELIFISTLEGLHLSEILI
jgi:hypothetical protein